MKKYCLFYFLIVLFNPVYTQNTNYGYEKALKISNLTSHEIFPGGSVFRDSNTTSVFEMEDNQVLHPVFAFTWKNKTGHFHEVELTDLSWNTAGNRESLVYQRTGERKVLSDNSRTNIRVAFRYEYMFSLNHNEKSRFHTFLGISARQLYHQYEAGGLNSSDFPVKISYLSTNAYLVPHLSYYMSDRIFIDLNVPFSFIRGYYVYDHSSNPGIEPGMNNHSEIGFDFTLANLSCRLGVGFKL